MHREELKKAPADRYVHAFFTSNSGKTLIITFIPFLLALVHDSDSFECDKTFKRCRDLDEWEMVIYYRPAKRGEASAGKVSEPSPIITPQHLRLLAYIPTVQILTILSSFLMNFNATR